jgi:hypothetical protein
MVQQYESPKELKTTAEKTELKQTKIWIKEMDIGDGTYLNKYLKKEVH